MSSQSKSVVKEIKEKLANVCTSKKVYGMALDYLRNARTWKYAVANKSNYTVNQAKQILIAYKNDRDRLMPYNTQAVEIVDSYFPVEIGEVQARPDTQVAKLAGADLRDIDTVN